MSLAANEPQFYDRKGNIRVPAKGSIIRNRKGAFGITLARKALLLTWQLHAPEVPELPGGGVDAGEDAWKALAREFNEETGMDLRVMARKPFWSQHIGFYADDVNEYWHYDQDFYLIHGDDVDPLYFSGERISPEQGRVRWVDLVLYNTLPIHYCHALALKNCL